MAKIKMQTVPIGRLVEFTVDPGGKRKPVSVLLNETEMKKMLLAVKKCVNREKKEQVVEVMDAEDA